MNWIINLNEKPETVKVLGVGWGGGNRRNSLRTRLGKDFLDIVPEI